ncbi:MAG: hypothetical protein ACKVJK_10240 [Methylophagaceae bacterium]|tara:strand:+ start:744 stop:920 length:177 start_codon:yes stop_codon:yes gene_type:complete
MKTSVISDLKLYFLNATSFAISLSSVDMILKIVLLALSIGYTIDKWAKLRKKRDNEKD